MSTTRYTNAYWREFVENVNNGSNYFRYSEYLQLLDEMDSLAAERDALAASHKALVSALKDAQKSCNDMRSEHRLHGHITDASAHWAIVVEPRIMEALAQAEKVAK